jgi:hypothetical protein
MIAEIVYALCGLTSLLCAFLLYRRYCSTGAPLLLWSTWCFVCFVLTNILLFVDFVVFPDVDLSFLRGLLTLAGMVMLLYGMIRERM